MSLVYSTPLPSGALLEKYAMLSDAYTDCFAIRMPRNVTFEAYVEAFYTSWLFRLERLILTIFGMPSTDAQAVALAGAERSHFAAWSVEARAPQQLLLDAGSTRSWLMLAQEAGSADAPQILYFGSAVVASRGGKMAWPFRALLGFHKLYSRLLLAAAARRLRTRHVL